MSDKIDIDQDVEYQIKTQGVATYKVSDGEVFVFTSEILQHLLTQSKTSSAGRAIVFVKSRSQV